MMKKDVLQRLDNVTVNVVGLRSDIEFIPSSEICLILVRAIGDLSFLLNWSIKECLEDIPDAIEGN